MQKLQIVLVLALDQFFDFDVLHDAQLGEALLQDLEVPHELVVELSSPVHLSQRDFAGIEHIHELAVYCARPQLLDFRQVYLEKVVEPSEQLAAGHFDGVVGVYSHFVDHPLLC